MQAGAIEVNNLRKRILLLNGLPEDAKNFRMVGDNLCHDCLINTSDPFGIPLGKWVLLARMDNLTEDHTIPLVHTECTIYDESGYTNYNTPLCVYQSAVESFKSALEVCGAEFNNNTFVFIEEPIEK